MTLSVQILSQIRVQAVHSVTHPQTVLLSILDAAHLISGTTSTIILYDAKEVNTAGHITPPKLQEALARTLNDYPQWCGHLHRQPGRPGRLMLTFGDTDPGVAFIVAKADSSLADLIPPSKAAAWDLSNFPESELMPACSLSVTDLKDPSLPSLAIQITVFSDHGVAIALRIAHPLADAHCLADFVLDWSANMRSTPFHGGKPLFTPQLLDECASEGRLPGPVSTFPLPTHRYDPWISDEGCPFPGKWTEVPEEFRSLPLDPPGVRIPWQDWDCAAPVTQKMIHFAYNDLQKLQAEVMVSGNARLSYHDALIAHLWSCVTRARSSDKDQNTNNSELIYLTYAIGIRKRTLPKLPARFMGSPTIAAAIPSPVGEVGDETKVAQLAMHIRSTIEEFNPERIATYLHLKLKEHCPHRFWPGFMGRRHLMATSWVGTNFYDADFGMGRPRFVKSIMPKMDGILHLIEGPPSGRAEDSQSLHWTQYGVNATLYLAAPTMEKLLEDPLLWKFRQSKCDGRT